MNCLECGKVIENNRDLSKTKQISLCNECNKKFYQSKPISDKELENDNEEYQKSIVVGTNLDSLYTKKIKKSSMMLDDLLFDCPEDLDVIYKSIRKIKEVLDNG